MAKALLFSDLFLSLPSKRKSSIMLFSVCLPLFIILTYPYCVSLSFSLSFFLSPSVSLSLSLFSPLSFFLFFFSSSISLSLSIPLSHSYIHVSLIHIHSYSQYCFIFLIYLYLTFSLTPSVKLFFSFKLQPPTNLHYLALNQGTVPTSSLILHLKNTQIFYSVIFSPKFPLKIFTFSTIFRFSRFDYQMKRNVISPTYRSLLATLPLQVSSSSFLSN